VYSLELVIVGSNRGNRAQETTPDRLDFISSNDNLGERRNHPDKENQPNNQKYPVGPAERTFDVAYLFEAIYLSGNDHRLFLIITVQ
jgi:hypothetical protein